MWDSQLLETCAVALEKLSTMDSSSLDDNMSHWDRPSEWFSSPAEEIERKIHSWNDWLINIMTRHQIWNVDSLFLSRDKILIHNINYWSNANF